MAELLFTNYRVTRPEIIESIERCSKTPIIDISWPKAAKSEISVTTTKTMHQFQGISGISTNQK